MRHSFDSANARTQKETQYYKTLGSRGLWHQGWKVVADHGPTSGMGNFDQDRWQLFHTDDDRSEAQDLAEQHPDKVREVVAIWFEEAHRYNVP
jgi:arylsulfatase A-like enzyme